MRYTIKDFQKDFPNDDACLDKIMELKYGPKPTCPGCGVETKFHKITKRRAYACQDCGHHIYPCAGTPFEKSRTPLTKWLFAMFLFTASKNGVAAKELERQLGVTYKCAWRIAHELRKLMANADDHEPLSGHVEIDETFIGGKVRGRKKEGITGRGANKTVVFGMLERDGSVRAGPVPNVSRKTIRPIIAKNIQRGSIISTDEFQTYADLKKFGYQHGTVVHGAKQYVNGIFHVNSLEGYWGQLKRGIKGTHIHVSPKHLWKYVSEFSYRYNMRKEDQATLFQDLVLTLGRPHLKAG